MGAIAAVIGVAAFLAPPLQPAQWAFDPKQVWPSWPGPASQTLVVLVAAMFAIGLAAFVRRPQSGIGQALLAGTAANAASVALGSSINPEELTYRSGSWVAFVAAGFLSL